MSDDVWEILGIPRGSSADEVKRAYRTRLKRTKPESDPEGFRRLREAYEKAAEQARYRFEVPPAPDASALEIQSLGGSNPDEPPASADAAPSPPGPPAVASVEAVNPVEPDPPNPTVESMYARFDATDPADVEARLEVAREAGARFPGHAVAADLLSEALAEIEEPDRRLAELRRAHEARTPGIDRLLLYEEPTLLSDADVERLTHDDDRYLCGEAMVHLARRGRPERTLELARAFVSETEASAGAHDPRGALIAAGLELFATGQPVAGREVETLVRRLDERLRPLRGDYLTTQYAYLRELAMPSLVAEARLVTELALEVLGPQPGRARGHADRDVCRKGRSRLKGAPALAALVDAHAPPPAPAETRRRSFDFGGMRVAGFAIFAALQLVRFLVALGDDEPAARHRVRERPAFVARASDERLLGPPDAAHLSVLSERLRVTIARDGGVGALCGGAIPFCPIVPEGYACGEPSGTRCIDGAEAVRAASAGDCTVARERLQRIYQEDMPPHSVSTFARAVRDVVETDCPALETRSSP